MSMQANPTAQANDDVGLDRDLFLRMLLRDLAGNLQELIGQEASEGYMSLVGASLGDAINKMYLVMHDGDSLDIDRVAQVLVDLKEKIQGDFYIVEISDKAIVLQNRRCPFGDFVQGRTSLCMMTSNVFGRIAADNLGYAKVDIEQAIARGDPQCRVVVNLDREAEAGSEAREYFKIDLPVEVIG